MERGRRLLVGAALGGLAGGLLSALLFIIGARVDGTGWTEAIGFSLVFAFIGAALGVVVGGVAGATGVGALGGGLIGLLAALAVAAFYVMSFGRPGELGHFLSESRVILIGLGLPMILTGAATALLMNAIGRR